MKFRYALMISVAMGLFLILMCAMAQTWTQTGASTNRIWLYTSATADGKTIYAITSGSHPIYSTDYGKTWQANLNAPLTYDCLAMSADGNTLATMGFLPYSIY